MQQVVADDPGTGTRLRINADRQLTAASRDAVLRVLGEQADGGRVVFDATFVEVDTLEAQILGNAVRALTQPPPRLLENIARQVQALYGSQLDASDARQVAQIATSAAAAGLAVELGQVGDQRLQRLAERCERAAGQSQQSVTSAAGGNGDTEREQAQARAAGRR